MGPVDHDLAGLWEIHGDFAVDIRLHLTHAPIGAIRMLHPHSGFEKGIEVVHGISFGG